MQSTGAFVVVGSFGIDTNVYPAGERLGLEMTFAHTSDGLGQAGCYSALAASALGLPTRAIAALGDDRAGAWVREELASAGITLTELRDPGGTHRSVNIVADDGSRRNYFDPRRVSETVVDLAACRAALAGAAVVHFSLDDWARRLVGPAADAGAVVSCDLQDLADLDDPYRADFVTAADVLFMSGANVDQPAAAALELAGRRSGRVVVVGLGAEGCLVAHGREVEHYHALDLVEHPVVDTNGAGDNLAVGFLVARYVDGERLDRAAWRAQLGARWICAQRGDAKQPLTRAQLARLSATVGQPDAPR
jgi:sugar/nucleoside kinase (ribokinase family)